MTQPVRRYVIAPEWTTPEMVRDFGEVAVIMVPATDYLALEAVSQAAIAERDQLRHECARLGAKVSALDGLLGSALAERDALRAERERVRRSLQQFLGNPACPHNRLIYKHQGRADHAIESYDSCGSCGANITLLAALATQEVG